MPTTARSSLRAVALAAAVLVAACGGRSTSTDDALKRDLDAASGDGLALAPRGSQTQVVSAVELGEGRADRTGTPAPAAAGAPAPHRLVARAVAPRVVERVRVIERVVERRPAPEPEVAVAPAPEPAAAPAPPEPVPVAAPSPGARHLPEPVDAPARGRGGRRPWDMGDVIRNAPFPINP